MSCSDVPIQKIPIKCNSDYEVKSNNEMIDDHIAELEKRIHEPFTGYINPIVQTICVLKEMKTDD